MLKIAHNKAKNEINFNVSFSELIPMKELFSAADIISKKLGADTAIYPKYFPELLNSDYLYEIIELLKKKFVSSQNHSFRKCTHGCIAYFPQKRNKKQGVLDARRALHP